MADYEENEKKYDDEEKYFEEVIPEERTKKFREKFLEWSQKGDMLHLTKYINDPACDLSEGDSIGWTPIIWAIVNNRIEAVKLIIEKIKKQNKKETIEENSVLEEDENNNNNNTKSNSIVSELTEKDFSEIFKKPLDPTTFGKYTPLHWSAYKGNVLITSILIKSQYDPLEIDIFGNTALHQAAASNNINLFRLFMGLGIDLELKNSRSHTPLDLTSNDTIKQLIKKSISTLKCELCNKRFDFFIKRYFCNISEKIICKSCCICDYYFIDENAIEKELLECRSITSFNEINKEEENLLKCIENNSLDDLNNTYNLIKQNNILIGPKIKRKTILEIDRLSREKKISTMINDLNKVENHKTIEKSVHLLMEEIEDAKKNNITIDTRVLDKLNQQKTTKLNEKELRKILSNLTVSESSNENKDLLEMRILNAENSKVDDEFLIKGRELLKLINLNLSAHQVENELKVYPPREYPVEEVVDPKNKKKKVVEKKKKRKKKEPPFDTPVWAKEAKDVEEKIKEYKNYISMCVEIGLSERFIEDSKVVLDRFKKEIKFRKNEEEIQRQIQLEKEKKNKKKKK